VRPSKCCCSTEAGSVSPWVTMMRRNCERARPGNLLPGGLAVVVAEADGALR